MVASLMAPGKLDLLCYIDPADIPRYGIPYLNLLMTKSLKIASDVVNNFWKYFNSTWVNGLYDVELWNIYRFQDCIDSIQNRTNNPLERFNRTMNDHFGQISPSLPVFIEGIKKVSAQYVQDIEDVQQRRKTKQVRQSVQFLYPPEHYLLFKKKLDQKELEKREVASESD